MNIKIFTAATLSSLTLMGATMLNSQAQEKPNTEVKQSDDQDAKSLIGTYKITSGERNGKKVDSERLQDVTVRFEEKVITTFDKDKKEFYAATYELDTKQKPWKIMMTATIVPVEGKAQKVDGKGTKAEGLIEFSGETVRFIYSLPEGKAPTEFKTGDKQQMFVLMKTEKQEPVTPKR